MQTRPAAARRAPPRESARRDPAAPSRCRARAIRSDERAPGTALALARRAPASPRRCRSRPCVRAGEGPRTRATTMPRRAPAGRTRGPYRCPSRDESGRRIPSGVILAFQARPACPARPSVGLPEPRDQLLVDVCDLDGARERRTVRLEDVVALDADMVRTVARLAGALDEQRGDGA